jgi:hypothetical protein
MSNWRFAVAALSVLAVPVLPVHADQAGPFDGKWVIDFLSTTAPSPTNSNASCPAMRIVVDVKNNMISGNLARETTNPKEVSDSTGPGSTPITGQVGSDGAFTATWQGYVASGNLAANSGTVIVVGECGPRQGTAVRAAN